MIGESHPCRSIIGFPVTASSFDAQIELMLAWAKASASKVVCIANVHMLIEGYRNTDFAKILQTADLITPDGMPLVWMLKLSGIRCPNRVAGLDVLLALCDRAQAQEMSVFFLGSQQGILDRIEAKLHRDFPTLKVAGMDPLPFRPLTAIEDTALIERLNQSGARLIFVSLGCPKQEYWMHQHQGKVQAVMIGLGGAFPVYAGIYRRAPYFLRSIGLEWLYRLLQEPRRLFRRYLNTIPLFIWLACCQVFSQSRSQVLDNSRNAPD